MAACGPFNCLDHFAQDAWHELRGQPFRDEAFTDSDWRRHLTWRRYLPEPSVLGIVALTLAPIWLWSVFVSLCLGLYATFAEPAGAPNISGHLELLTPFSLTSFALSLLMLFKTNSSYSRFWEARTLWGSGYITVRSILRLSLSFVGRARPDLLPALYRWTAALLPALAAYLRDKEHYLTESLEGLLLPEELAYLQRRLKGGVPPIAALQVLSRLLDMAPLHEMERQQLEALLSHMDTIIGGCERILRQPVPQAYNRHTHRFILCYITFLPAAFWPRFGWATLPIMAIFSFLIAGAENVGVQIEEPHRVLPLNGICAGTLRALRCMWADAQASADMAAAAAAGGAGLDPPEVPRKLAHESSGVRTSAANDHPGHWGHRHGLGLHLKPPLLAAVATSASGRKGTGHGVKPSQPSGGLSTPPTARPLTPDDMLDAAADRALGAAADGKAA